MKQDILYNFYHEKRKKRSCSMPECLLIENLRKESSRSWQRCKNVRLACHLSGEVPCLKVCMEAGLGWWVGSVWWHQIRRIPCEKPAKENHRGRTEWKSAYTCVSEHAATEKVWGKTLLLLNRRSENKGCANLLWSLTQWKRCRDPAAVM